MKFAPALGGRPRRLGADEDSLTPILRRGIGRWVYFVAESADRTPFTSFTVASGQPSAFQRSGIIARVAFPSIRRSPSKSDVNQSCPFAFKVPACPGPINGPLVVARKRLPPRCSMSTPALSRYGPVADLLRPMRML